jgi:hypothetical protein
MTEIAFAKPMDVCVAVEVAEQLQMRANVPPDLQDQIVQAAVGHLPARYAPDPAQGSLGADDVRRSLPAPVKQQLTRVVQRVIEQHAAVYPQLASSSTRGASPLSPECYYG